MTHSEIPNTPSIHTLHDYDSELAAMYDRVQPGQKPPRISNPELAHELGNELFERLAQVDLEYDDDLQHSERAEDPIVSMQEDLVRRDEAIKRAASQLEWQHRHAAPVDFINGERHYFGTFPDAGLQKRMDQRRKQNDEQ